MSPILVSPPCRPSIGVLIACARTGSAVTAKPAAIQAATKPRRATCTSGNRLFKSGFCRSRFMGSSRGGEGNTVCRARLFHHARTALRVAGGALERVRELQHAEVVAIAADDLQPDRQSLRREARGHRDGRMAGDADVVAALHPIDVVL